MAQAKIVSTDEFWLFHDVDENEINEMRDFLDLELDLSSLDGFMEMVDKLNHFFE